MGQPTPPADPSATPPADPSKTPEPTPTTPPATGDGLGDAGKKALEAERAARKELEKQIKELQARNPVAELLAKLGEKPAAGQDANQAVLDRIAALERSKADAELRALRAEVANAKKLPDGLAARLQGSTKEELEADADALLALIPAATGTPGTPKPDPSQGPRGGANDLAAAIAEATKAGDWQRAIALKRQQLTK